ncbi:MAG: hypothetical protein ACOYKQ_01595 [Polymorphobacter sp.]
MAPDPALIEAIAPVGVSAVFIATIGWVMTQWLRMRHGYPLENSWGKPLLPHGGGETMERVKLLAQENAQLRAEVGSMKDRLQVLERIAVDRGTRLAEEIDNLPPKALN